MDLLIQFEVLFDKATQNDLCVLEANYLKEGDINNELLPRKSCYSEKVFSGKEYWESILNNELSPLTYRCIQGLYAPGSTFKMVVAIAGIIHGIIDTNTKHFCSGKIGLGDRLYHCWKNNGHGSMNISDAIKELSLIHI